jgi:hypothetical protein
MTDWTLGDIKVLLAKMSRIHKCSINEVIDLFENETLDRLQYEYIDSKR